MHSIDLGDFSEPETPFRAPAKRLPAGSDEPKELGEVLAPAAAGFEHKGEEFDPVTAIVDAVLSVLVKLLLFPLFRGVSGMLSPVPEEVAAFREDGLDFDVEFSRSPVANIRQFAIRASLLVVRVPTAVP